MNSQKKKLPRSKSSIQRIQNLQSWDTGPLSSPFSPLPHFNILFFFRWAAVPAINAFRINLGGVEYGCFPFNGWFMGSEIARYFPFSNLHYLLLLF